MKSRIHEDPVRDIVAPNDAIFCSYPEQVNIKN